MKRISLALTALAFVIAVPAAPALAQETVDAGINASILVPENWVLSRKGDIAVITAPEGDAFAAIVPMTGVDEADEAIRRAWAAYDPAFDRTVRLAQDLPADNGWTARRVANYETSPAEQLALQAVALKSDGGWTVALIRGSLATIAKRGAQLSQAFDALRPRSYSKESFAGKQAHDLDETRILALKDFLRTGMDQLGVPGIGLALVEDGKIVWEGGLGVKEIGGVDPVDANTRFMIASNTKGMATLLLSTLVDEGKLKWDQPVTQAYPAFRLGSDETTGKVQLKHLVCACTGLPRKDMEWIFNTAPDTPADEAFRQLAATEPTTGFGEVFQYNNLMASAAGYVGAKALYPNLETGAAFRRAMDERIFGPLGMTRTTFDTKEATTGNWARPHDFTIGRVVTQSSMELNSAMQPFLPAGGAWSTPHDMAQYVINELNEGVAPGGKRLVSAENLLERRAHSVPVGENRWYGMGLFDDREYGVSVIQHGGSLLGYKSNWFAIPEAGVGAVILTNSDSGQALLDAFSRRLLEVLYDGEEKAAEQVASIAERSNVAFAKMRSEIDYPGNAEVLADLAPRYANEGLGPLTIRREGNRAFARATTFEAEIATKKNEDGTWSVVFVSPGFMGGAVLVGEQDGKRTLTLDDSQHKYVWIEQ